MLSINVKSTSDLFSIALQAEREAIRRYTQLMNDMRKGKNESAAALFDRMVTEEKEHERLLLKWMQQEGIDINPNIEPVIWSDPNISTIYNDDARDPFSSSPYKALAFAVHNEEIAFRFYTHVAANTDNDIIRLYAETLAREELGHAALLRAERRIAYRREKGDKKNEPALNPQAIHNEVDLLSAAIHIDNYLSSQMSVFTDNTPAINDLAIKIQEQIRNNECALNEQELEENIFPGKDITDNLKKLKAHNSSMVNDQDLNLQRLWSCCDRSFAFYDAIMETATDEDMMLCAQKLTVTALDRISVLKDVFGESDTNS